MVWFYLSVFFFFLIGSSEYCLTVFRSNSYENQ